MEEILNRLRQFRAYAKLSQVEFGQRIDMAGNSYSQIETGVNPLKDRHIALICHAFGVNENWLRTGEGDMLIENSQSSPEQPIYDQNGQPLTKEEEVFMGTYRKLSDPNKEVARTTVDALLKSQRKTEEKGEMTEIAECSGETG
ncbi:MAG: helix-turn-helix transcriptional regulator [Treponema sp.]|jgi:transcriptional regulator with XRE-family HTH domain|nr:helix-turn-helix transcriptional regulator [Treponema sp.]